MYILLRQFDTYPYYKIQEYKVYKLVELCNMKENSYIKLYLPKNIKT